MRKEVQAKLVFFDVLLIFIGSSILVRELWLGNLPENLNEKKLKNVVDMFGEVENIEYYQKVKFFTEILFPAKWQLCLR